MHKTAISKIEKGQRLPSFEEAVAIASALGVPLKDLAQPLRPVDVFSKWDRTVTSFKDMARRLDDLADDARMTESDLRDLQEFVRDGASGHPYAYEGREALREILPDLISQTETAHKKLYDMQFQFNDQASALGRVRKYGSA